MEKQAIIELLNKDLQDEHGAIIQYLGHAWAMGEGELACEIEGIARDEMRHLDWLAEAIVELGGVPSLERGTMRLGGKTVPEWMSNDVLAEEGASEQYKKHIEMIDDPKIKRLLKRILSDEEAHHGQFVHFVDKSKKEGLTDRRGSSNDATLDWGVNHEYTVILQYLFHSFMTRDEEASEQLQDQAINEMQHMGWLAEAIVDGDGTPKFAHAEVDRSAETADMLKADIGVENEVIERYGKAAAAATDPSLKKLFLRMRDNEQYHKEVFTDLLEETKDK